MLQIVDRDGGGEPPQFVGKTRTVEFPLIRGQGSVQVSYSDGSH